MWKTASATLLAIVGIILSFYIGGYLLFVGGVSTVISAFKAPSIDNLALAIALVKIVVAAPIGWAIFLVCSVFAGIVGTSR